MNNYKELVTSNENVKNIFKNIMLDIKNIIIKKNIDIGLLCNKLFFSIDDFAYIMNTPVSNYSMYLEILDVVESY